MNYCVPREWFFLRNGFDDFGSTRLLKFRSKVALVMRCVAWKRNKNLFFIHIRSSVSRQGWKFFHKMLERFLMKHDYSIWYRNHLQASLQPPSESLRASYAEKVMLNGPSVQQLIKQSISSPLLTGTQHWVIKNPKVLK